MRRRRGDRARFAIAALCLLAAACGAQDSGAPDDRGIVLGLYHADPEFSYAAQVEEIAALGADSVSMISVWMTSGLTSEEIHAVDGRTVPDEQMIEAIRTAHGLGLRVMLFPIVLLENPGEGEWRGRLSPKSVDEWFDSYRSHVLGLAQLAEREGVEMLSIGSELSSLERHTDEWVRLIDEVRQVYSGQLTYSANWDHLSVIEFWDRLDFVSMSSYFILAERPDAPEDWLDGAWTHHRDEILAWHSEHLPEMRLVLAEVGYASQDGIAQHPWDYTLGAEVDLEEQRRCYAAFIRAWHGVPALRGVYFYEWGNGEGGADDGTYTPRGKPAEELVRAWYQEGETPDLVMEEVGQ